MPFSAKRQFAKATPQLPKTSQIDRGEMREILFNARSELANSIDNNRAALGGTLSGVGLSGDLGARYTLECIDYLLRRI